MPLYPLHPPKIKLYILIKNIMSKVAKTQPVLDKSMKMECTSTASLITIKIVFQPYKITVVDSCIMESNENLMS